METGAAAGAEVPFAGRRASFVALQAGCVLEIFLPRREAFPASGVR